MKSKNLLGYGTLGIDPNNAKILLLKAFQAGYDFIDTAWIYKNEEIIGDAIANEPKMTHFKIQTKIWVEHYKNLREQAFTQLKALKKNRIWSMLLHRPSRNFNDSIVAWKELIKLKEEGIVERIGVSNFDKDMINILIKETGITPQINQIELSVQNFREDRVNYANENNIEIQSWAVLGTSLESNETIKRLALKYNVSWTSIAISYISSQGLNPVVKTNNEKRILENCNAARNIQLSQEELLALKDSNIYLNKYSESIE